jgi:hypothetical protein
LRLELSTVERSTVEHATVERSSVDELTGAATGRDRRPGGERESAGW